mgnify:CR=1 FL=1
MALLANFLLMAYLLQMELIFTLLFLGALAVGQLLELLHFVKRTNRELARFLETVRFHDSSTELNFPQHDAGFKALENEFEQLFRVLKGARSQQDQKEQLMQLILENIHLGILVFTDAKKIELLNERAQEILNVPEFTHWNRLQEKRPELVAALGDFNFSGRKVLRLPRGTGHRELYLDLQTITLAGKRFYLVSLSDLRNEIEQKEIDAWHKLIRILAHEVMNSVTPVVSLSETLGQMLTQGSQKIISPQELSAEQLEDIYEALNTIQRRSRGMLGFVEQYRKLTQLPAPQFETVSLHAVFTDIEKLMQSQAQKNGVNLQMTLSPKNLAVKADQKMLEQVLLNLIKNALVAIAEEQTGNQITVKARLKELHLIIEVTDNGPGIEKDVLPQIFIPFYSTRKNGSGIGLTLSKNIMRLHQGQLEVESEAGKGATFRLLFPN